MPEVEAEKVSRQADLGGHAGSRSPGGLGLAQLAEWREVFRNPLAETVHDGWLGDYRMAEANAQPGYPGRRPAPGLALAMF